MTIKEKISTNKYKAELLQAQALQNEAAFFIERNLSNPYLSDFRARVNAIYNKSTYKTDRFFKAFQGDTMPSIEVCETIYGELFKVWDSMDSNEELKFTNDEYKQDAEEFLKDDLEYWKSEGWEAFKTKFNSIVIVDLKKEQNGKPEPYQFILDISKVKFLEFEDNEIKEIIFLEKVKNEAGKVIEHYYYFTDEVYSLYEVEGTIETEKINQPHQLGYCPAHFLINTKLNSEDKIQRTTSISSNIEDLTWYNIKVVESRKADLLDLNPDKQTTASSCGYKGTIKSKVTSTCKNGFLINSAQEPILNNGVPELCPVCGERQHNSGGAGNLIAVNQNSIAVKEGKIDPSRALTQYISPEIQGVQEQYKRIIELKESIICSCVGKDQGATKEAVNEKQVVSSFEGKENILRKLASDLAKTREWSQKTKCKLRHAGGFVSNTIFGGSKFYIYSIEDLLDMRNKAHTPLEKQRIDEQIIEVRYKNNPNKLAREKLLYKLMPLPTLTDAEFLQFVVAEKVSDEDIVIRTNFISMVFKFESEYGDIVSFYNDFFQPEVKAIKRLDIITDLLKSYAPVIKPKVKENVQD